jgi:hypothetical protein
MRINQSSPPPPPIVPPPPPPPAQEQRGSLPTDVHIDIATVVLRIEQIAGLAQDDALRDHLIDRLVTCDAPRLRRHLSGQMLAEMEALTDG